MSIATSTGASSGDTTEVERGAAPPIYVAFPEKALLDLFHFTSGPIRRPLVEELRLAPGQLDPGRLDQFAKRAARPKLARAASLTVRFLRDDMVAESRL